MFSDTVLGTTTFVPSVPTTLQDSETSLHLERSRS
jgi:hypothetical protein